MRRLTIAAVLAGIFLLNPGPALALTCYEHWQQCDADCKANPSVSCTCNDRYPRCDQDKAWTHWDGRKTPITAAVTPVQQPAAYPADVACATLPTVDACYQCGAAKYGQAAQMQYCQREWGPGRQPISFTEYTRLKNGGYALPMQR